MEIEYNTARRPLILGEHGRYIQEMVRHIKRLESKEERTKAAATLVEIMSQLSPKYKGNDEMEQKLWDDLYIMSNHELDIDGPYPKPEPLEQIKPEKIKYPDHNFKYKHYGKVVESLIEAAKKLENPDEKQELTHLIANLMKRSYLNYNRDSVNEEMIIDQLKEMSGGELEVAKDFRFQHTNEILSKTKRTNTNNNNKGKGRSKKRWKKN